MGRGRVAAADWAAWGVVAAALNAGPALTLALAADHDPWLRPVVDDAVLNAVDDVIGNARVVGLGEHIHTAGGVLEVKEQIVEHLVRDRGFRIVALETGRLRSAPVMEYVEGSRNDPLEATAALTTVFDDVATLRLLEFLHGWNASHPADPVAFVGFDADYDSSVVDALRAAAPDAAVVPACELRSPETGCAGFPQPAECLRALDGADIAANEGVRLLLIELRHFAEACGEESDARRSGMRDATMAALMLEELARRPEARAVVWAHNAHVAYAAVSRHHPGPMGEILRGALDEQYVALAFSATETDLGWPWASFAAGPPDRLRHQLGGADGAVLVDALHSAAMHRRRFFAGDFVRPSRAWSAIVNLDVSRPAVQTRGFASLGALDGSALEETVWPSLPALFETPARAFKYCIPMRQLRTTTLERYRGLMAFALEAVGFSPGTSPEEFVRGDKRVHLSVRPGATDEDWLCAVITPL